jgi:hypothetical protein
MKFAIFAAGGGITHDFLCAALLPQEHKARGMTS